MTMSPHTSDRHRDAFVELSDGSTARKVFIGGGDGIMSGIVYDYVSITYPTSTTETWTFKTGGSGGTITATVSLTYDSSGRLTTAAIT